MSAVPCEAPACTAKPVAAVQPRMPPWHHRYYCGDHLEAAAKSEPGCYIFHMSPGRRREVEQPKAPPAKAKRERVRSNGRMPTE